MRFSMKESGWRERLKEENDWRERPARLSQASCSAAILMHACERWKIVDAALCQRLRFHQLLTIGKIETGVKMFRASLSQL